MLYVFAVHSLQYIACPDHIFKQKDNTKVSKITEGFCYEPLDSCYYKNELQQKLVTTLKIDYHECFLNFAFINHFLLLSVVLQYLIILHTLSIVMRHNENTLYCKYFSITASRNWLITCHFVVHMSMMYSILPSSGRKVSWEGQFVSTVNVCKYFWDLLLDIHKWQLVI